MTFAALVPFLLIMLAPAVGSFLAVLVDRLPRGEDVVRARSGCRDCATPIAPWDLIPIASFIMLRGRCRTCAAPIPPFLFYMELLALGAAILAVLAGGASTQMVLSALWLWLLIALAVSDLIWFRLPDMLTAALALVALAFGLLSGGIGLMHMAVGAALGAGSFAALRWSYKKARNRDGLGLGDVKLMVGLGGFVGPYDLPLLVLMAALMALAFAILTRSGAGGLDGARALPFGAALCAAGALLWLLGAGS